MQTLTLEVEAGPPPRREEFGEGILADRRFDLAYRRWRAAVTQRVAEQTPAGYGLFKWRIEERPGGKWIAVAELVKG